MSGRRIVEMGANEFFEDLTYSVAYGEIMKQLRDRLPLDDGYIKDALQSSLSVVFSAGLLVYMQKQEQIISKIFDLVFLTFITYFNEYLSNLKNKVKSKFSRVKGRSLKNALDVFGVGQRNSFKRAELILKSGEFFMQSNIVECERSGGSFLASQNLNSIYTRNNSNADLNLKYAKAQLDSLNFGLLLKLFTAKFTNQDMALVNRILGENKETTNLTADDLNKVASFMFVADDNGNITGLAEQFMQLLNGLGYFHNKLKRNKDD